MRYASGEHSPRISRSLRPEHQQIACHLTFKAFDSHEWRRAKAAILRKG
jgi:hypothetical protein